MPRKARNPAQASFVENFGTTAPDRLLAALCERWHIRKLALFGSALRGDFRPDSDVDVLVEFEPGHTPDFFALFELETELSALMNGHPVDLVTTPALNRHLRTGVLSSAKVIYEQG
ncbi:MAG TPA: nucleotidyltransferase family protein [Candidatus Limnocylindrales bacterium]|nr:nucleotidyltransferase family protein [Candidatus Limnocylindrales bacterium]